jgi:phage shock protein A
LEEHKLSVTRLYQGKLDQQQEQLKELQGELEKALAALNAPQEVRPPSKVELEELRERLGLKKMPTREEFAAKQKELVEKAAKLQEDNDNTKTALEELAARLKASEEEHAAAVKQLLEENKKLKKAIKAGPENAGKIDTMYDEATKQELSDLKDAKEAADKRFDALNTKLDDLANKLAAAERKAAKAAAAPVAQPPPPSSEPIPDWQSLFQDMQNRLAQMEAEKAAAATKKEEEGRAGRVADVAAVGKAAAVPTGGDDDSRIAAILSQNSDLKLDWNDGKRILALWKTLEGKPKEGEGPANKPTPEQYQNILRQYIDGEKGKAAALAEAEKQKAAELQKNEAERAARERADQAAKAKAVSEDKEKEEVGPDSSQPPPKKPKEGNKPEDIKSEYIDANKDVDERLANKKQLEEDERRNRKLLAKKLDFLAPRGYYSTEKFGLDRAAIELLWKDISENPDFVSPGFKANSAAYKFLSGGAEIKTVADLQQYATALRIVQNQHNKEMEQKKSNLGKHARKIAAQQQKIAEQQFGIITKVERELKAAPKSKSEKKPIEDEEENFDQRPSKAPKTDYGARRQEQAANVTPGFLNSLWELFA